MNLKEEIKRARGREEELPEWIGKLPPLSPEEFPDSLTFFDLIKRVRPGLFVPNGWIDKCGIRDLESVIERVLEQSFHPVINGRNIAPFYELTLGDLRTIGIEGLRAFDNLRVGFDIDIAAAILIPNE